MKRPLTPVQQACLAALGRCPMIRGSVYRHGRRGFAPATVNVLVGRGLATRVGDQVVRVDPRGSDAP